MNRIWMTANSIAWICVLVLFMSSSIAVGADVAPPQDEVLSLDSAAAAMDAEFSYQGVLKSSGVPVNGTRNFIFQLHSNATCTKQLQEIIKNGVPITDGRFSVSLLVKQQYFNGQKLYLQVAIDATRLMCEEILAVPYALSIMPGAEINTATADVTINTYDVAKNISKGIQATARGGTNNFGLVGVVDDTRGAGVYAVSNTAGGDGLYARNPHGGLAGNFYGDVAQNTDAYGLVKAGVLVTCGASFPGVTIWREFGPNAIVYTDTGTGECELNFGFDLSERFWSTSSAVPESAYAASCNVKFANHNVLVCSLRKADLTSVNGEMMVLVY